MRVLKRVAFALIPCLLVFFGGAWLAISSGWEGADFSRAGSLLVALSFFLLFGSAPKISPPSRGGVQKAQIPPPAGQEAHQLEKKILLSTISVFGTLWWGFGDIVFEYMVNFNTN